MKLSDDFVLASFTIFVHVVSIDAVDSIKEIYSNYEDYNGPDNFQSMNQERVFITNTTTINIQYTSCSVRLTGGKKNPIDETFLNDCEHWSKRDRRLCQNIKTKDLLEVCTNFTITFDCTKPDNYGNRKPDFGEYKIQSIQKIESIITSYYHPLLPVKNIKHTFDPAEPSYLNINWEEPDKHKLCIKVYYINATSSVHGKKIHKTEFPSFILTSLEPGEKYTGIVYGVDEKGEKGESQPVEFTTPDNFVQPELTVSAVSLVTNQAKISWECNLQGSSITIEKYLVHYWRNGTNQREKIEVSGSTTTIRSLNPCTYYNVSVAPKTSKAGNDMVTMTDVYVISSDTCMEITKNLNLIYGLKVAHDDVHRAILNIPNGLFVKYTEVITNYSIIIRTVNDDTAIVDTKTWSSTTNNWADTQLDSSILIYRTTPDNWHPFRDNDKDFVTYTIGEGSCTTDRTVHCNGPLKPSQQYELILRVCSKYGCIYSKEVPFHTKTPPPSQPGNRNDNGPLITPLQFIGLIFTVLLICAGLYYIINAASGEDGVMDAIMRKSMPSDMTLQELISKTVEDMEIEYNLFDVFLKSNPSTNVAMLSKNRPKNRYTDILPYDYNRVELKWGDNDYINASLIHDSEGALKYIACQGPMPNTCVDMWQMVLEQNVVSIVMLCKLVENEKIKCDKYFPDANEQIQYGDIKVRNNNVVVNGLSSSTISELTITKGNMQKTVSHFQYHDWPDFGTPEEYATLVEFCQNVNKTSSNGVIVVHCSAGVGRTGTYIACDLLKKAIYLGEKLNVFKTVLNLRKQRTNMVQTQDQYNFIYGYLGSFVNSSD